MRKTDGMTLIELLIATSLLAVIVLGVSSIDLFSRYQILSADRRVKSQNGAAFCIDHMTKHIIKAIGDTNNYPVVINDNANDFVLTVKTDSNQNGVLEIDNNIDIQIAYRFIKATGALAERYQVWYYPNYADLSNHEVIARGITTFIVLPIDVTNNYIDLQIGACSNPDLPQDPCGTITNPTISMRSRVNMPSVSTH